MKFSWLLVKSRPGLKEANIRDQEYAIYERLDVFGGGEKFNLRH
jgi:hypothetical protein